jgi:hypothetical protein
VEPRLRGDLAGRVARAARPQGRLADLHGLRLAARVRPGLLLRLGERDTRFRFAGTVVLHDGLMYAALVLVVGHLYLAVIHPATRHALRGMTVGTVDEKWARRHHATWRPE